MRCYWYLIRQADKRGVCAIFQRLKETLSRVFWACLCKSCQLLLTFASRFSTTQSSGRPVASAVAATTIISTTKQEDKGPKGWQLGFRSMRAFSGNNKNNFIYVHKSLIKILWLSFGIHLLTLQGLEFNKGKQSRNTSVLFDN